MPDHEPFDGTVPVVVKMTAVMAPRRWAVYRPQEVHAERFATWREAMNYATKEDHR